MEKNCVLLSYCRREDYGLIEPDRSKDKRINTIVHKRRAQLKHHRWNVGSSDKSLPTIKTRLPFHTSANPSAAESQLCAVPLPPFPPFFSTPRPLAPPLTAPLSPSKKKEIIPLWHPSRARFSPLFSASVPFDLLAPPPPNRATTRLEAAAVVVVVLMVVVMVHPSSLSLSPRCTARRESLGAKREKEKSRAKKKKERTGGGGSERLSRGWRDKGEEIIRRKERGRKEWNGGTASRRIVERA